MKSAAKLGAALIFGLILAGAVSAEKSDDNLLLRIKGDYLGYSLDLNRLIGDNTTFRFLGRDVACRILKADLASRTFLGLGGVTLSREGETLRFDALLFEPGTETAVGFRYGQTLEVISVPGGKAVSEEDAGKAVEQMATLDDLNVAAIRESLISATAGEIEVTQAFEAIGRDVVMYVEGFESVGFPRFKLSIGEKQRTGGFSLDKIWFNRNQGLFANASYLREEEGVLHSLTQARYEEHSILKSYAGLPRQLDLQTETRWTAAERLDLGLSANYNTTGLWNARLSADSRLADERGRVLFDLAFNKPLGRPFEAWLGIQSSLRFPKAGSLNISGKTEMHGQRLAAVDYHLPLGQHFRFALNSRYSRLRLGTAGGRSNIFTGNLSLSYDAERFDAAAEYYLNRDLVGDQRLSQPVLRVGLRPFPLYGGLLEAAVRNTFLANDLRTERGTSRTYSNNTAFSLAVRPIHLRPALSLQVAASVEQFLEKEGRNFTSGGGIFRAVWSVAPAVTLEGFYSLQSRRRTRGWLIEGTTSQDFSAMLRIDPDERLNGWLMISYDPKTGDWKQGYADLAVGLVRNWEFQALMHYDFYRSRIGNVDLSLVRHAGRFDLRFIWRSLSRQVMIELIPAFHSRRPAPELGKNDF
ncbi:MAG: hypothetical protein JW843_08535 [Candidatus Aminicenantes bacterium]|nr:hypothetical protein [Candidatus Aminicenantes bacterium]